MKGLAFFISLLLVGSQQTAPNSCCSNPVTNIELDSTYHCEAKSTCYDAPVFLGLIDCNSDVYKNKPLDDPHVEDFKVLTRAATEISEVSIENVDNCPLFSAVKVLKVTKYPPIQINSTSISDISFGQLKNLNVTRPHFCQLKTIGKVAILDVAETTFKKKKDIEKPLIESVACSDNSTDNASKQNCATSVANNKKNETNVDEVKKPEGNLLYSIWKALFDYYFFAILGFIGVVGFGAFLLLKRRGNKKGVKNNTATINSRGKNVSLIKRIVDDEDWKKETEEKEKKEAKERRKKADEEEQQWMKEREKSARKLIDDVYGESEKLDDKTEARRKEIHAELEKILEMYEKQQKDDEEEDVLRREVKVLDRSIELTDVSERSFYDVKKAMEYEVLAEYMRKQEKEKEEERQEEYELIMKERELQDLYFEVKKQQEDLEELKYHARQTMYAEMRLTMLFQIYVTNNFLAAKQELEESGNERTKADESEYEMHRKMLLHMREMGLGNCDEGKVEDTRTLEDIAQEFNRSDEKQFNICKKLLEEIIQNREIVDTVGDEPSNEIKQLDGSYSLKETENFIEHMNLGEDWPRIKKKV